VISGGRARGRPARIVGWTLRGRWSEEEERKDEAGRRQVGSGCQRKRGGERELGCWGGGVRELGRAWKEEEVGRAEQDAGKEERAVLAWPRAGEGKGNGPTTRFSPYNHEKFRQHH
jgi:hypothetical protein